MTNVPDHGTRARYVSRVAGCRCDRCRAANARYMTAYRALPGERRARYQLRLFDSGDPMPDDDLLDAGCEPGLEEAVYVAEIDVPFLVLFADVDWNDEGALLERAREWRELFG